LAQYKTAAALELTPETPLTRTLPQAPGWWLRLWDHRHIFCAMPENVERKKFNF